ncbi:MAG: transglutaminase-like domain-containing protein [Cyclobacteriaceae bacterium]
MIAKSRKDLFLGLLLMVLPTAIISFPLLDFVSEHYSLLFLDKGLLIVLFSAGIGAAYILHSTRLRFLLVFGLLILGLYMIYQAISVFPFTEFDAYYIANRFRINATVFMIGWFTGFGISRWRYFLVFYSVALIGITIVTIPSSGELDVDQLVWLFAPPVFYAFYILFIKELLHNIRHQAKIQYHKIFIRVVGFSTLIFLLFWLTTQLLDSKFDALQEQIGGSDGSDNQQNQNDDDSMLDKDGKNQFRLKDYTELRPRLRQSDELLFCAYIDNFFAEGVPNPQYITLYHLNQYNVNLERFEIDPDTSLVKDIFLPDPTTIPNYFIQYDSSVLLHDRMEAEIKPVKSTIYINQLSPDVFVAPSTAFSCQPISVEEEFREQYRFAYNVFSEVSTLNSAYFVYNARDPNIREFQKQRYDLLGEVEGYEDQPQEFMDYYTRMPQEGETYAAIRNLADSITKDAETPIDKILAIRDYFLSKDENGEPLFEYTLTPGSPTDPNIPDASLLHNFLFNTQKGYCTYFATSSLFMLRSLGIPVRMSVGFMTVDRSHNNPGWYWFYADQAHAWSQVYFPEYGWLDFDFTISNEGAAEAPAPDGTPPTPPTDAPFVSKGIIEAIDTAKNELVLQVDELLINQIGYELTEAQDFEMDAVRAKIYAGKTAIKLHELELGDSAVVVSFDQKIAELRPPKQNENGQDYFKRLPDPIIIDEVHTAEREEEIEDELEEEEEKISDSVNRWVTGLVAGLILILLLLFVSPYIQHQILLGKIRGNSDLGSKSVAIYRHLHFILNQMGIGRGSTTPMNYAIDMVDPKYQTNLKGFIEAYLKLKYSNEPLTDEEKDLIINFYPDFNQTVLNYYTSKERVINFLKFNRWFYYIMNLNLRRY